MRAIDSKQLLENLQWRYATKKFDPTKKIPAETWQALEQAMILAPSSFGVQPWRFYEVSDKSMRAKLRAASWNQAQIEDASHMVVFASRVGLGVPDVDRFIARVAEVREVTVDSLAGYRKAIVGFIDGSNKAFDANTWAKRQTYIALGFLLESAAMLGIDACPMEGFDAAQYDELLGIGREGYTALAVVTAGYRAADDAYAGHKKVRFPAEDVIRRR